MLAPSPVPPVHALGAARLRERLASSGGFTLDPVTGEQPTDGYAVCPDQRWSRRLSWHGWEDQQVAPLLHSLAPELRRRGRFLGGWLEPDRRHAWIEVVVLVPSAHPHAAARLARRARQMAVFDLGALAVVPLGGALGQAAAT